MIKNDGEISLKDLYERIVRLEAKVDNVFETGNNDAKRFTRYAGYVFITTAIEIVLLIAIYWRILHG